MIREALASDAPAAFVSMQAELSKLLDMQAIEKRALFREHHDAWAWIFAHGTS